MVRYRGIRCAILAFLLLPLSGPVGAQSGETRVSGRMLSADGRPLAGVVLLEEGRLYSKNFTYSGRVDAEGRYSIRVKRGGDYGLHLYATGHVYFPLGIAVREGEDNVFEHKLPPNAARAHAPSLADVRFDPDPQDGDRVTIRVRVADPDDNLSHQILAANTVTQEGLRMKPDGFVLPWTRNYPNGEYTLRYDTRGWPLDREEWVFVAADNRCYTSDVLGYPFTADGVIDAAGSVPANGEGSGAAADLSPAGLRGRGAEVYAGNCRICHYADQTRTKVGPGLKGLFARELTPVRRLPVTEAAIRAQIEQGSQNMPPYGHVRGADLDGLIAYLKTL